VASAAEVRDFHNNADTDGGRHALHHTLGPGTNQAAPGSHTHDGGTSAVLDPVLTDVTISGSLTDGTALKSVIAALTKLGATDGTTA
jgi:hypothetical protein